LKVTDLPTPVCRSCGSLLRNTFVDLGMFPLCESYVPHDQLNKMEPFYPLHVFVCEKCFLVQIEEYVSPERIFTEYAYYSSFSEAWLQHAKDFKEMTVARFGLTSKSLVVEVGSNDGYLLQYFVETGIPVLGIEPAENIAKVANQKGIPTMAHFFGERLAIELVRNGKIADLIIGNNVLAQVPNLNDFIKGMKILLKPGGTITIEFPHLMRLVEEVQFDTIYHEHYSYFSFLTTEKIFSSHGLTVFDVEEISTHGGSLRIYVRHTEGDSRRVGKRVADLRKKEKSSGMEDLNYYLEFEKKVMEAKRKILEFLIRAKRGGKTVVGYGAPGKGNILLVYCGIRTDFLDFTVDRNPYKQGKFLPGTHIPIFHPDRIKGYRPDYVMILPWNLKSEIMEQLAYIKEWGGKFIIPIPEIQIIS
jgi:2-polyprenyl-3-methyl-5-hydroxy-6-metoxy-1,4-benzoquinol methylase